MGKADARDGAAAWHGFLREIESARADLRCGEEDDHEAWFRGLTDTGHSLLPSLFRHFKNPNDEPAWTKIWWTEQDLYWEFSARARELHVGSQSDWDILFAMQHHGTPTRLLDWTETLGVAVYFALLKYAQAAVTGGDASSLPVPCVWVLNPYRLNKVSWTGKHGEPDLVYPSVLGWDPRRREEYTYGDLLMEDGVDWKLPVAIYPRRRNDRIHAQRGWFTIHGDKFVPLESVRGHEKFLRKVEISRKAVPSALAFLDHAGLDHFALFPDLTNLSRHLREKNGLADAGIRDVPQRRQPRRR